jgi:sec-independent protein translocase protein TatA
MGSLSIYHILVVAIVFLVLFGKGRISETMGDFGKGIRSFRQGMSDETDRPVTQPVNALPAQLQQQPVAPASAAPAPAAAPAEQTTPGGTA